MATKKKTRTKKKTAPKAPATIKIGGKVYRRLSTRPQLKDAASKRAAGIKKSGKLCRIKSYGRGKWYCYTRG